MTMPDPITGDNLSIVLIGMRGSGKTTVACRLIELVGGTHADTDELIVARAGRPIADLFEEEGEAGFRQHERDAVAKVVADRPAVISVGGGAVMDSQNTDLLREAGKLIWLTAPAEVLWERIHADPSTAGTRPALTHLSGLQEVEHLLAERKPIYEAAADVVIDTTGRDPGDIAVEILDRLDVGRAQA